MIVARRFSESLPDTTPAKADSWTCFEGPWLFLCFRNLSSRCKGRHIWGLTDGSTGFRQDRWLGDRGAAAQLACEHRPGKSGSARAASDRSLTRIAPSKPSPLGIPGLFPGRVVEVFHEDSISGNRVSQPIVGRMLSEGMKELTGESSSASAWQKFIEPHDVVGIKINSSGAPVCYSSPEIVREDRRGAAFD